MPDVRRLAARYGALLLGLWAANLAAAQPRMSCGFTSQDFVSVDGFRLLGQAIKVDDVVRLTRAAPTSGSDPFVRNGYLVYENDLDLALGFTSAFRFSIRNVGGSQDVFGRRGGDGVYFSLRSDPDPTIGSRYLSIWLDTFANPGLGDISSNRVEIGILGEPVTQYDAQVLGLDFEDGSVHEVSISGTSHELRVTIDGIIVATRTLPVGFVLPASTYVSMGSFTGGAYADHLLLSWSMRSGPSLAISASRSAACISSRIGLFTATDIHTSTSLAWHSLIGPLTDGPTPWGSIISGSATDMLTIDNIQPQDAGLYVLEAATDCGTVRSNAVPLDVYCDCDPIEVLAGLADGFALPRELTSPSSDLVRVLLERRPGRPFHEFDQIPVVTPGVENDSRLAHSFSGLPADIVGARLTMRVQAGGSGNNTIIAEGTDSVRLGFTTAQSTGAGNDDRVWERRFGDLPGEPIGLFDAEQIWTRGDTRLFTLDIASLPTTARLGEVDPNPLSLIDQLNANGFLDVTVVDETGVDFMLLEVETADGRVVAWASGPIGTQVAGGGSRVELTATGGELGGPFTYQWWREGSPISLTTNPTAQSATLVIDPATGVDMGEYMCLVAGLNTCGGPVFTEPVTLVVEPLCPADVNADGLLNFFDLSAFLAAFNAQDPAADIAPPFDVWNFFDISVYLGRYNSPCP